MNRKPKDCINCRFELGRCKFKGIDNRQLRKLNRTADKYGIWDRFYCKNYKKIRRSNL